MNSQQIQSEAATLLKLNYSVHPVKQDKSPAGPWKKYQTTRMLVDDVPKRFHNGHRLAIVAGGVSGNLEALDIDDPTVFEPFMDRLADHSPGLPDKLCQRETPNGYHIIYRCEAAITGNQKLAMSADNKVLIETRGEGGYFLHAPSDGYKVIKNSLKDCPVLSVDEVQAIHFIAGMFDERVIPEEIQTARAGQGKINVRPGDLFNHEHTAGELLENYGWKIASKQTGGMGYTRPDKGSGVSGVVMEKTGKLYCWSSNAHPLEPEESYSPFALLAAYEYGGDFQAAASSLSQQNSAKLSTPQHHSSSHSTNQQQPCNYSAPAQQNIKIAALVREYIENGTGKFTTNDVTTHVCARNRQEKLCVYTELKNLKNKRKIKKIDGAMSTYEVVEPEPDEMNIDGDMGEPINIPFPLDISSKANVYPGSIILIVGDSNAGKTAFLLAILNGMLSGGYPPGPFYKKKERTSPGTPTAGKKWRRYLNCEMSAGELKSRLRSFGTRPIKDWKDHVSFIERNRLFHQLVLSDGFTFIDYLDVTQDFFEAPHLISQIHEELDTGIAIVAMQKSPDRQFAVGGAQTIAKPRLVINLINNEPYGMIAKLIKVKEPVDFLTKPQGKEIDFQITPSCEFQTLSSWRFVSQKQRKMINAQHQQQLNNE